MKITTLLNLFLLINTSFLCAQEFTPGYIITAKQDTISGLIIDRTDADLVDGIQFKRKMSGRVVNYEPEDLKVFEFDTGRFFKSLELPARKQEEIQNVFAKNILRGEIDLYVLRHKGRTKPDLFVHNNSSGKSAYLRKPEKRERVQNGKSFHTHDQHYLGNLQLVKGEAGEVSGPRFSEKLIKKDIIKYNSGFEEEVPQRIYEDEKAYSFDLVAGIPIRKETGFPVWRISAFMNKNRPELTRNFYFTYGIYFDEIDKERELPAGLRNGRIDYKWHTLNVMPFAFKYQGSGKIFQPYGYLGGGVSARWITWLVIEDYNAAGKETELGILPTINAGVGTKIDLGTAAFVAEVSPSLRGVFLSAGISF